MAQRFWVLSSGNTNDTAHWSATSGGAGGASVPTSTDDAIFDFASSATPYTVTVNASFSCANFLMGNPASGVVTLTGISALSIYGNFELALGMTCSWTGALNLASTTSGNTITMNGVVLNLGSGYLAGVNCTGTGGYILQDDFNIGSGYFNHNFGSFNTNGKTVTCGNWDDGWTTTRSTTFGASTINCSGTNIWFFTGGFTFSSGTSTFNVTQNCTFNSQGMTFNNVHFVGAHTSGLYGTNIWSDFTIDPGATVHFQNSRTQTATTFNLVGTAGNIITLDSDSAGVFATLTKTSGKVQGDYLSIKDSHAGGGATYYAGLNSTLVSGNTGWVIASTLSTTKTSDYAIIAPVSTTLALQYAVSSTPGITKDLGYKILTSSAITKGIQYTIKTTSAITKTTQYAVVSPVGITESLQYTVKTTSSATKALAYTVSTAPSITKTLEYGIITTPAIQKSLGYKVQTSHGITKGLSYALLDSISPVITLLGASTINLSIGDVYIEYGSTAVDNIDGDITAHVIIGGSVNTSIPGTYILTYNVSDQAGNAAIEKTRTVIIIDGTPPVITLLGNIILDLYVDDTYVEAGYIATDSVDGNITANIVVAGSVNTSIPGTYILTYNVSDAAGNPADEVVRTIYVSDFQIPANGFANMKYTDVTKTRREAGITGNSNITDAQVRNTISLVESEIDSNISDAYVIPLPSFYMNSITFSGTGNGSANMTITIDSIDFVLAIINGHTASVLADLFRTAVLAQAPTGFMLYDTIGTGSTVTIVSKNQNADLTDITVSTTDPQTVTGMTVTSSLSGITVPLIESIATGMAAARILIMEYGAEAQDTDKDGFKKMALFQKIVDDIQKKDMKLLDFSGTELPVSATKRVAFYPTNVSRTNEDNTANKITINQQF